MAATEIGKKMPVKSVSIDARRTKSFLRNILTYEVFLSA